MRHRRRVLSRIWLLACPAVALISGLASAETGSTGRHEEAKQLYLMKCSKCHRLYDPEEYEDSHWSDWMIKMKKKAHLNDEQYDKIVRYVESLRKG